MNSTFGPDCSLKCNCNGQKCHPITGHCLFDSSEQDQVLPDQTPQDITTLPLLKIYPLASSAQYACEHNQNAVKTRWFFDTKANLSVSDDIFEPGDENSVNTSNLTPGIAYKLQNF